MNPAGLRTLMYAFLPFLFLWIREKKNARPLLGLWALSLALAVVQLQVPSLGRLSILAFIPCFLPGVIAFKLLHRPRIASWLWPCFILILVAAFSIRPELSTGWILCLILGLMVPQFREVQSRWLRWTSHRIATYSYGIYVSHQFCIWTVFGPLAQRSLVLRIPLLVAMLVLVPVLLYHAIEQPMIKVGVRLAAQIGEQTPKPTNAIPKVDDLAPTVALAEKANS